MQGILALQTLVCYWPTPSTNWCWNTYPKSFNTLDTKNGSVPVRSIRKCYTSKLLNELTSPRLDALTTGQSPFQASVLKGSEVSMVGTQLIMSPAMQWRHKKLFRQEVDRGSHQARQTIMHLINLISISPQVHEGLGPG